jgi:hypothetical protein
LYRDGGARRKYNPVREGRFMALAISVLAVVLFPALALRAIRTGGPVSLWRRTGLAVGLILLLALVLATPWAGNALTPTYGYWYIAPRVLLLSALTLGLPVTSTSLAFYVLAERTENQLAVYAIGVICAAIAWIVGILAAIRILYAT